MKYDIEELANLGVEYLGDKAKIFVTSNGAFVFTGEEFIAITEPPVTLNLPPIPSNSDDLTSGTKYTLDIKRRKDLKFQTVSPEWQVSVEEDLVRLASRVEEIEALLDTITIKDGNLRVKGNVIINAVEDE